MKTIKLYLHYVSINIRCIMQYKTSFLLTAIGQFLVSVNYPLSKANGLPASSTS
jgi:ABC-2 type transport system permease protein